MIISSNTPISQIQKKTKNKVRGLVQGWRCACGSACIVYLPEIQRIYARCEVCYKPFSMVYGAKKQLVGTKT